MQLNQMPPSRNARSRLQWMILTHVYNFKGKSVLDLGCGYADIIMHCANAGGRCVAVDRDQSIISRNKQISRDYGLKLDFLCQDIDHFMRVNKALFDVIICFSVIPYLYDELLGVSIFEWISRHSKTAFLEIQYNGDGPGLPFINNDNDMAAFLIQYFSRVRAIGRTDIPERNKHRVIWECK